MKNVNITEKYALCMLKEKKTLYEKELSPYIIVSMVIEMMLNGNLEITEKNKVILTNQIPASNYNKNLYEIIKLMNKDEVPLKVILKSICYCFSNKKLKAIINSLKDSMLANKLISLESKKGLLGTKEVIKIDEDEFTDIINEIKSELLEKGSLSEDLILLASLLNSTKFLKNIFNKYEKESLNTILKEVENSQIAKKVKVAQSVIKNMSAIITGMLINSSRPL